MWTGDSGHLLSHVWAWVELILKWLALLQKFLEPKVGRNCSGVRLGDLPGEVCPQNVHTEAPHHREHELQN